MPDADTLPSLVHCSHCSVVMHRRGAQAMTVEPDGERRPWTVERAAYFLRYSQGHAPTLHYLCQACTRDVFGSAAPADERGE